MYVAKLVKNKLIFHATVLEKHWSKEMLSNSVNIISEKSFLSRRSAHKWINAEITRDLFMKKRLEIIDE